jgi:hypothetical protein
MISLPDSSKGILNKSSLIFSISALNTSSLSNSYDYPPPLAFPDNPYSALLLFE